MSEIGQKIIAEIRRVAAENPDIRVPGEACVYVDVSHEKEQWEPRCLVGQALFALGLLDELLPDPFEEYGPGAWNETAFDHMYHSIAPGMEQAEVAWVRKAQEHQDSDKTWSESVRTADLQFEVDA